MDETPHRSRLPANMPSKQRSTKKKHQQACASCEPLFRQGNAAARLLETTAMFTIALVLLYALKHVGVPAFDMNPNGVVSLGAIFLIGIVASAGSCLALVGGLLLSVSAAWCEDAKNISHAEKFQPLALFNIGRLVGYFAFGGLVALAGSAIGLSLQATGYMTIALSLIMLMLGLKILHLLPKRFCTVPLPSGMLRSIRTLSTSRHPLAAFALGAATFFVPCGFTQSVQLLALGSGNFMAGGTMMFVFALGTLPALLGISALSAFAEDALGRLFFRFSGAVVVLLSFVNLSAGFTLTGLTLPALAPHRQAVFAQDPNVSLDSNGQQIMSLSVSDRGYSPRTFTVRANTPTWVYAVAEQDVAGCASELSAPAFNKRVSIKKGGNWLGPITPQQDFVIACSMGMFRVDVRVVRS